jgi:hypothetical protein
MIRGEGHHHVSVEVILTNGTAFRTSWEVDGSMGFCYSKAPRWVRQEMREKNIRGRSKWQTIIVGVRVWRPL